MSTTGLLLLLGKWAHCGTTVGGFHLDIDRHSAAHVLNAMLQTAVHTVDMACDIQLGQNWECTWPSPSFTPGMRYIKIMFTTSGGVDIQALHSVANMENHLLAKKWIRALFPDLIMPAPGMKMNTCHFSSRIF